MNILVSWSNAGTVYLRQMDTSGNWLGSAGTLVTSQTVYGIDANASGGYTVSATGAANCQISTYDSANSQVATFSFPGRQANSAILDSGNLFVVYLTGGSVAGRVQTTAGATVVSTFDVSQDDTTVAHPDLAVLADGRVAVAWTQQRAGSNDISFRIFNADGTADTDEVVVTALAGRQERVSVTALNDGGFVLTWCDLAGGDGSGEEVMAQRFDSTGTAVGSVFVVNSVTAGNQWQINGQNGSVAQLHNGDLAFVFATPGAGGDDVVTRVFDVDGNPASPTLGTSVGDLMDGDGAANAIDGAGGDDTVNGLAGDDSLEGGAGADVLDGRDDSDTLDGGDGNDLLYGGGQNDILNGGAGADVMLGGDGDDNYLVDDLADQTIEGVGGISGLDTVRASISWTLGDNIEKLVLDGGADLAGTGNALANQITGNGGNNVLDGADGKDVISGGLGSDTIIGGTGNDILAGGGGADTFAVRQESIFSSADPQGRTVETDTVGDYAIGQDIIDLSAIDAIAGGADDAFVLVGAFSQMTLKFAGGVTTLSLDVDGDGKADYLMKITGNATADSGGWQL